VRSTEGTWMILGATRQLNGEFCETRPWWSALHLSLVRENAPPANLPLPLLFNIDDDSPRHNIVLEPGEVLTHTFTMEQLLDNHHQNYPKSDPVEFERAFQDGRLRCQATLLNSLGRGSGSSQEKNSKVTDSIILRSKPRC
jgi:hypothetical protein